MWCVVFSALSPPPLGPVTQRQQPHTTHHAFSVSSRQRFSHVLQQSIEHLVRAASAIELAEQPCAPRGRHPHTSHGDLRGAALEVELEEGFRAAAVDDLDRKST